jgi:hypothetical protein
MSMIASVITTEELSFFYKTIGMSTMDQEQQSKKIGEILAKCGVDDSFKQRLLTDTRATLETEGILLPEGLSVQIHENTPEVWHVILPNRPKDLTDDDLDAVAGGRNFFMAWLRGESN